MSLILLLILGAAWPVFPRTPPPIGDSAHVTLDASPPPAAATPPTLDFQLPVSHPSPAKPAGVQNPKELTLPVKLVFASIIMDGGSVCGKLRGANGKEFWFFLAQSIFPGDKMRGLYVGYVSGYIPESARADFKGWTEPEFCSLLEHAIKDAFSWDASSQRLVPKNPRVFDDPAEMEDFGGTAAKKLLRYAEHGLRRADSYMK